jgi:NAD(P)-dependent dehydrogenase (short-subunit alcohol dehydrogenase family)
MSGIGSSERPDWPTAVVVGAGGLGMAVARRLGLSHRLLVADRDADHVERQCAALRSDGYDAVAVTCDVTRPADIARLAAEAATRPAVKTLATVVGLSPAAQDFHAIMAVNLVGATGVADAFVDVLEPGGAAVFISSSAAHMQTVSEELLPLLDDPLRSDFRDALAAMLGADADANRAYTLSKAGLNRMCRRKAADWGRRGLRIVSLSPGLIATPQGAEAYKHSSGKVALFEAVPVGRECSMLEIAGVVAFLASDQASYITGTDILVDGGLIAAVRPGS